ncbi:uncharacterized protein LOC144085712 isoform X9 [Stigmatopora argus]
MPNRKRKLLLVKMLPARAFANVSAKHLSHSQKPESPKMKEEDAESPQIKTDEEVTTWTFEFGPSQSETDDKDVSEKHLSHSQKRVSPKTDEEVTTWTFEFCPSQSENDDKGVSEKHLSQCQMSVSSNIQEEEETGSLQIKKEAEEVNVTKLTLLKVPSKSDNYDKDVSGLPETPHIKKEEEQFPYINEERVFSHNEERENREVPYIKEEYEMNITDLPLTCGPLKTENKDNVPIIETIQALPPSTSSNDMKDDDADSCGPSQAMEFTVTTRGGRKLLYNGYAYTVDKMRDGITYWKCEGRRSCGGRLKTVNDILLGLPLPHCHRPDPSRIVVLKTVQKMKERASNTQEITSTLIENIQALPPSTSSNDMKDDADRCGPSRCSLVRKLLRCIKNPQNQTVKGNVEQQSIHIHASDTAIGSRTGTSQSPRQNTVLQEKQRAFPFTINFASKRRKTSTPRNCARLRLFHFCLMPENSDRTPKDEAVLLHAGLGRRTVILSEGATNTEITTVLLKEYPKLQSLRGGWLLQRASGRSGQRKLSPVPQTSVGYTARTLWSCSQKGKDAIYIVPIQDQIDTSPLPFDAPEFANMPKNTCMACGASVPLLMLPFHMKSCYSEAVNDVNDV